MKKRLLSILLTLCMVCSVMPVMVLTASAYNTRTTAPDSGNSYYYSSANPFYSAGLIGQCTWYAYGRAYEILGSRPRLSTGNAKEWYSYNQSHGYYAHGTEPRVGAIACWYLSGANHVAVVEAINGGTIYISEFNRNSDRSFHYTEEVSNGRGPDGYIYLTEAEAANTVIVTTGEAEKISTTEYTLHGSVHSTSVKVTEVGLYIGVSPNNLTKLGSDSVGSLSPTMWYNTAKYGYTLESGALYYYQAYAVAGGQTYWGDVKSFSTELASSSGNKATLWYDANGGTDWPRWSTPIDAAETHTFTISDYVPERSGYTFLGWSLRADAQIPSYYSGDEITISSGTTLYAVWKQKIPEDSSQESIVQIDFTEETISVSTDMQWTEDPSAVSPDIFTALWDDSIKITNKEISSYRIYFGNTLYFREGETGDWRKLVIPERPTAPTGITEDEGEITGVSTDMEYKPSNSTEWIGCNGTTIKGLDAGTYYVRFKATNTSFASDYTVIENGSATYAVTVDSAKNGSVFISPKNTSKGKTVTITVKPDSGYELDVLTAIDKNGDELRFTSKGDGKYTFIMPASKVTVKATFVKEGDGASTGFVDVSADAYYANAVAWAVENGITSGTSTTTFSPDASCTRAQMVTFLWRAAGSPKATGNNPFTDVQSGAYYYDAVLWAVGKGVTSGTSATTFSPNDTAMRAMVVTILHRMEGEPRAWGYAFSDVATSAYYADAVAWAAEEQIVTGTSNMTFSPDTPISRGQFAAILYRYAQYKDGMRMKN